MASADAGQVPTRISFSPFDAGQGVKMIRDAGPLEGREHGDLNHGEPGWDELKVLSSEQPVDFTSPRQPAVPADEELAPDSPAAIYIHEISLTPLLTAEEEVRLAQER